VKISNEFMSGIERGAKLPSLSTLEKLAGALRVNLKDLFNFDRSTFHHVHLPSREGTEVAFLLEGHSLQKTTTYSTDREDLGASTGRVSSLLRAFSCRR